jgi:hypothetical protein
MGRAALGGPGAAAIVTLYRSTLTMIVTVDRDIVTGHTPAAYFDRLGGSLVRWPVRPAQ